MTTDAPDIPSETPLKGMDLIKDESLRLPDSPGVYRMMGEAGEVLYVGKAKSLKKRVTQYAQGRFHTQRIAHMVHLTRSLEFVTTQTETEALLLAFNFIKTLEFDQLIWEFGDKEQPDWVHVSYAKKNRKEVLKAIKKNGVTKYVKF